MNDLFKPQMQPCAGRNCGSTNPNLHSAECFEDYEKATGMAQPEQEPVAWGVIASNTGKMCQVELDFAEVEEISPKWVVPLYTTPQRTWVGLTDEEVEQGLLRSDYALQTAHAWRAGVVFAMAKLKEKNNG